MFYKIFPLFLTLSTCLVLTSGQTTDILTINEETIMSQECLNKVTPAELGFLKIVNQVWNITSDQLSGNGTGLPPMSYCCGNWDMNNYVFNLVKKYCSSSDVAIMKNQSNDLVKSLNSTCAKFPNYSKACDPIIPTFQSVSQECTDKFSNVITASGGAACPSTYRKHLNTTNKKSNVKDQTTKVQCCGYWQVDNCTIGIFEKTCNSTDVAIIKDSLTDPAKYTEFYICDKFSPKSYACAPKTVKPTVDGGGSGTSRATINKVVKFLFLLVILCYFENNHAT